MAHALARELPADGASVQGVLRERATIELRRLTRRAGGARSITEDPAIELTGGVEVSARLPACAYDPHPAHISGRLGPGWSARDLERRVGYLIQNIRALLALRLERDGLYSQLQRLEGIDNLDVELAMAEEEAVSGHRSALDEMSEADVIFWRGWLARFKITAIGKDYWNTIA